MKKVTKLKLCNWSLVIALAAVLLSEIQFEVAHSSGYLSVWIHVLIGLLFMTLVCIHLYLHFGKSNWCTKFRNLKSRATLILWWMTIITLITGIATAVRWIVINTHSPLGGIHGKLGFLMLIISIFHIRNRLYFLKRKK